MKLENFFCFTSNFKLEQKVALNQKVFKEAFLYNLHLILFEDSLSPLTDTLVQDHHYNTSGSPTMSDKKGSNKDPLSESACSMTGFTLDR